MSNNLINNNNSLARAAERVRAKRAAERSASVAEPVAVEVVKTTTQIRARLNEIPDGTTLSSRINNALAALSRGIRWARGSIVNLLV